jgi:hypothetical protein
MNPELSRRCFFKSAAVGVLSSSALFGLAERLAAATAAQFPPAQTKARIGKLYLGHPNPGWPSHAVDLDAEVKSFEAELGKLAPALADVEFVDAGLVRTNEQLTQAKEKFKDTSGILVIHLTMGIGGYLESLFELNLPVVVFALPYTGHEWHTIASWQRQGKLVQVYPTSRHEDLLIAIRPLKTIHRLKEARVLHISQAEANADYCETIKSKFGTEIISLKFEDLRKACEDADRSEAMADARRWIKEATKIVEPTKEEIEKSSIMYIAMRDLLAQHRASVVTMNCLGMGLMDHGLGYPCLGFVRFNNMGLGGVCEADLKSTMTHLIFSNLVGRPGFVSDPVFDLSSSSIIHAHCVAATQMEGPAGPAAPYDIRSHLEDGRGVSLMVKLPVNQPLTMARLIGADTMLFSTGEAVDSPFVDRGCRSKLTMRVQNVDKFLENWSCGLHRVVFYGDHTRDLKSYCRFARIRVLQEGVDDLKEEKDLEWDPHVHA